MKHNDSSFYHASSYASAVFRVVILSVCLSICLFVTRVLCYKTKQCTADILIPHERAVTLLLWHRQCLLFDSPLLSQISLKVTHPFKKCRHWQISTYNVSTVRDSEKIQLWRIGNRLQAFQQAIDGVRTLKSPTACLKTDFSVFRNKIQFQSNEVCYKVLLCETSSGEVVEQSISYEITEKIGRKVFSFTWNIGLDWPTPLLHAWSSQRTVLPNDVMTKQSAAAMEGGSCTLKFSDVGTAQRTAVARSLCVI